MMTEKVASGVQQRLTCFPALSLYYRPTAVSQVRGWIFRSADRPRPRTDHAAHIRQFGREQPDQASAGSSGVTLLWAWTCQSAPERS